MTQQSETGPTTDRSIIRRIRFEVRPFQRVIATLMAAAISPAVPRRFDPHLTSMVTRGLLILLPQRRSLVAGRMAAHLGVEPDNVLASADAYWLQRVETRWGQARAIGRSGWFPEVEVRRLDRLAAAHEAGRGVILWRMSSHSAIPLNQALEASGFAPVHLSSPGHLLMGRANRLWKRFAQKMAPTIRRGEDAHLAERVEIRATNPSASMRRLVAALGENATVTIVGDLSRGRRTHEVTINQQRVALANGGARLAASTGAALLPVAVVRVGPMQYRIEIGEPLVAPADLDRAAAINDVIEQFAECLSSWIRSDLSQWPKWRAPLS